MSRTLLLRVQPLLDGLELDQSLLLVVGRGFLRSPPRHDPRRQRRRHLLVGKHLQKQLFVFRHRLPHRWLALPMVEHRGGGQQRLSPRLSRSRVAVLA